MKIKEIAELTVQELLKRKRDLRGEALHMRIQQRAGQLDRPHRFREIRREVARLETVLATRRRSAAAAVAAAAPAQASPPGPEPASAPARPRRVPRRKAKEMTEDAG